MHVAWEPAWSPLELATGEPGPSGAHGPHSWSVPQSPDQSCSDIQNGGPIRHPISNLEKYQTGSPSFSGLLPISNLQYLLANFSEWGSRRCLYSGPCYGSGVARVNLPNVFREKQGLISLVPQPLCPMTLNWPPMI